LPLGALGATTGLTPSALPAAQVYLLDPSMPAGGPYSAPPDYLVDFKRTALRRRMKKREGRERKERERKGRRN